MRCREAGIIFHLLKENYFKQTDTANTVLFLIALLVVYYLPQYNAFPCVRPDCDQKWLKCGNFPHYLTTS